MNCVNVILQVPLFQTHVFAVAVPRLVRAMVRLARSFQWAFIATAALVDMLGTEAVQDKWAVLPVAAI